MTRSDKVFLVALIGGALIVEFAILYYFFILIPAKPLVKPPSRYLIEVEKDKIPQFQFTFSHEALEELKIAFERQKEFLSKKINYGNELPFGETKLPASLIRESAELFLQTMQEAKTQNELNRLIRERFLIFQAAGEGGEGEVLFTGYYAPVYEGSLKREGAFIYSLYVRPEDLKVVDLGEFIPALKGERLVYRIDPFKGEIAPYWTREDITKRKVLEGQGLEFVYLKDRLDKFSLMIEGSGKIVLDDGETLWVNYAATNARPYTSLTHLLEKEGKLPRGKLSMPSIREYFQRHPEQMESYLNQNERFIFFVKDEKKEGATGATGCLLTPQRSIAIDDKIFPLGALVYLEYPEPQVNEKGEGVGMRNEAGFAFCQDTGGVIKGPGRADIYFGEGEKGFVGGEYLKGEGKLYFLIKK
ncbi:murein transglycosylase A [Candidatus Aerophobetes bacterium]|nr:murein transglycosylase A [Candidatus Aerophobetes bacterium]